MTGVQKRWESWDEHINWMIAEHQSGRSLADIADDIGVSPATVSRRLSDAGYDERHGEHGVLSKEKQWNWAGGVEEPWRMSYKWRQTREEIRERDGHACRSCGLSQSEHGTRLHVHHIEPVSDGGVKYDHRNLVTLCGECHVAAHSPV